MQLRPDVQQPAGASPATDVGVPPRDGGARRPKGGRHILRQRGRGGYAFKRSRSRELSLSDIPRGTGSPRGREYLAGITAAPGLH